MCTIWYRRVLLPFDVSDIRPVMLRRDLNTLQLITEVISFIRCVFMYTSTNPLVYCEVLKNYRPVSNLSFLSKIIEKIISVRILQHITDNDIIDGFQSAYKAGHSYETALLRVYNDIVITIGKGNRLFLVLLDLSAAFDTIDHDNLFMILERFVGISGSALLLIKSFFSGRTQRVVIDGILSDFANLVCGVPQGSVLGPMKFCLYLLPLCAILKKHNIGYHIYADDTQLYISFNSKEPLTSLTKLNNCISDIFLFFF